VQTELRLVESSVKDSAIQKPPRAGVGAWRRNEVFALVHRQMQALAGRGRDLDDLVQMAAEQVFRSLPRFEDRSALATWTYRICYFTLSKQRRWYRRWLNRFTYTSDGYQTDDIDLSRLESSDLLEQRERAERLRRALEQVSPKRRAVVILHDLEELEVEEIAAVVGANLNTVRSRLRDGRRLLAQALERDPYFGDAACSEEEP
jgi:RNA polymerase sigma-70 factor (ECF subfamily)